jgi:hypothetical protein
MDSLKKGDLLGGQGAIWVNAVNKNNHLTAINVISTSLIKLL